MPISQAFSCDFCLTLRDASYSLLVLVQLVALVLEVENGPDMVQYDVRVRKDRISDLSWADTLLELEELPIIAIVHFARRSPVSMSV